MAPVKKTSTRKSAAKSARKRPAASAARGRRKAAIESPDDGDDGAPPVGGRSLVIVESPAKAKTIGKYLGRGYQVKATVGHVRDLPEKKLGIDIDNGFEPEYVTIAGKEKTLAEIKDAAYNADEVYIATDTDREG